MLRGTRIGTIAGIEVRFHWSLVFVAGLLTLSLSSFLTSTSSLALSTPAALVLGVTGAVVFLASVLAHELGHAVIALREGVGVRRITLWLLGGLAELDEEAPSARSELRIAAAGPAVSIGLALLLGGAAWLVGLSAAPFAAVLAWLALVNGMLAIFNLLPAAPLDGGRILRAAMWWRTGDRWGSMITASRAGRVLAVLLFAAGFYQLTSGWGNGLWTMLLAWFVWSASGSERAYAQQEREGERRRADLARAAAQWGPIIPASVVTDTHPPAPTER